MEPHASSYLKSMSNQSIIFVNKYSYPNYFFNTAVGFSRSTLLKAKGKNIKPDRIDPWLHRKDDTEASKPNRAEPGECLK